MNKHLTIWSKTAVGLEKFEQKRQSLLRKGADLYENSCKAYFHAPISQWITAFF